MSKSADGRLPCRDQAALPKSASGGGAGDLDQRSAAAGQGARGAGEKNERLTRGGNSPRFEGIQRRLDERTTAEAAGRRPGRHGVDDHGRSSQLLGGALEG